MKSKRILLVEDDEHDIELTLTALKHHGLGDDVFVVRDGEQALDYLYCRGDFADRSAGDPAVIFLDLKLPKVDGLQVLSHIKSDPELRQLPIVVVTSSQQESDILKSYRIGVNAYVVKPMGYEQFVHAVQQLGLFWGILNQPPPASMPLAQ